MLKKPPVGLLLLLDKKKELKNSTGIYLRQEKSTGKVKENNKIKDRVEGTGKNDKSLGKIKMESGSGESKANNDKGWGNNKNNKKSSTKNGYNKNKAMKGSMRQENIEDEMKRRKEERTKLSGEIGKNRASGTTKGPGLNRKEALLVGKIMAETCEWDNIKRTVDELGGRWLEAATFYHFYVERWVVFWLSEGFWFVVEKKLINIIIIEGWDSMAGTTEEGEKELGNGLLKVGELWDFNVKLEYWPSTKGMSSEGIVDEFGKGLMWVLQEVLYGICWECGESAYTKEIGLDWIVNDDNDIDVDKDTRDRG